jgi:hypothetical protein
MRDLLWKGWNGVLTETAKQNSSWSSTTSGGFKGYKGVQVTESENHPVWRDHRKGSFQGDVGGNFLMRKQYVSTPEKRVMRNLKASFKDVAHTGYDVTAAYRGGCIPSGIPANPFAPFSNSSNAELDAWGAKAIALCKPTNNVANAATALFELYHEGLPHLLGSALWKDRTNVARGAGSDYLNWQFGFKPLADDIAKFAYGVVYFDRLLRQYEEDVGKIVRRGYRFPSIESRTWNDVVTSFVRPTMYPQSTTEETPPLNNPGAKTVCETVSTVDRWFSGAFTYYVPHSVEFGWLSQAKQLLGFDITPETIWNVTPWSWAVDWFTNAGSVISNYQSFTVDGMVMRYGYIMEHKVTTKTYFHHGPTGLQFGDAAMPSPMSFVTETKVRRRATPFGFGLTMSGLSNRQKSILAALGFSRSQ